MLPTVQQVRIQMSSFVSIIFVLKAGDVDVLQHTLAKYVLELAQLEYELAHLTPSLLAASSLYLALLLLQQGNPNGPGWSLRRL